MDYSVFMIDTRLGLDTIALLLESSGGHYIRGILDEGIAHYLMVVAFVAVFPFKCSR
jgi:hypothetical protein